MTMPGRTCDIHPDAGVNESEVHPGIYSFTCADCGRELWQEHEASDVYGDFPDVEEGDR